MPGGGRMITRRLALAGSAVILAAAALLPNAPPAGADATSEVAFLSSLNAGGAFIYKPPFAIQTGDWVCLQFPYANGNDVGPYLFPKTTNDVSTLALCPSR